MKLRRKLKWSSVGKLAAVLWLAVGNLQAAMVTGFTAFGGSWQVQGGVLSVGADAGAKLVADAPVLATGEVGVELLLPAAGGGHAGLIVKNFWTKTGGQLRTIPFVTAPPVAMVTTNLPPIAFIVRHPLSAPPAVGQDLWAAQPRAPGCGIRIFDGKTTKRVFDDPTGCIYDLNVSYDARTLFFSYRPRG